MGPLKNLFFVRCPFFVVFLFVICLLFFFRGGKDGGEPLPQL